MNYKDVLCISKNIMKDSIDFLKNRSTEDWTLNELIEYFEIFDREFKDLIDFLIDTPYFNDIMSKYFPNPSVKLGDEKKFYIDYLENSIHDYDKWGRDNYNSFITPNKI